MLYSFYIMYYRKFVFTFVCVFHLSDLSTDWLVTQLEKATTLPLTSGRLALRTLCLVCFV
uniref:Uncharacterized protein n=1 Tax=Anguilla anguilla TaxID=7936 RepID=A0A0E9S4V0_ANGAN